MRHQKRGRKLGRTASHRKALLSNLASSLIQHKKIITTDAKAKELRRFVEPLVTKARHGDLHSRRQVLKKIHNKEVVSVLFHEIAPKYSDRPGGYTRITKLGFRDNDSAPVSLIEFVDFVDRASKSTESKSKRAKKGKRKAKKAELDVGEQGRIQEDPSSH